MKIPQTKPSWSTGVYVGNGIIVPEKQKFEDWLRKCDAVVSSKLGLGLHDLADAMWRDYFEDGLTPSQAADCAFDDMWSDDMPSELWYG
tara:strand:+ start:499 stop:765 length:267 start_codon:yes stop_codon:yes gene_type:complete